MQSSSRMAKLVLMDEQTFLVSDEIGDIGTGDPADGLYHNDTRYLSVYRISLNGAPLSLLAAPPPESSVATVHLTNHQLTLAGGVSVLPQTISLRRTRYLREGLHDELELVNYNRFPVPFRLEITLAADFRDMFDIRGIARAEPGIIEPPKVRDDEVLMHYRGRDTVDRLLRFHCTTPFSTHRCWHRHERGAEHGTVSLPDATRIVDEPEHDLYRVYGELTGVLEPQRPHCVAFVIETREKTSEPEPLATGPSPKANGQERQPGRLTMTRITTSSETLNRLLDRGAADLTMLTWWPATGSVPVAGIPWFACPFGRDSLIVAIETLMLAPELAAGTLRFLATYQGKRRDDWRDEEPGKIMHELRFGELARLGAIPQSPYYGSVDATPLFLMLFAEATRWLEDDVLVDELWPAAEAALGWIEQYGDLDGDGLVEYLSRSPTGIRNQGWKDSFDSVTHVNGTLAEPPIALIDVQGYVYAARRGMAQLYRRRGDARRAAKLDADADQLAARVRERFWLPADGLYAEALDRDKQPVAVASSNVGHALYCGLAAPDEAIAMANRLRQPDMLAGWGLRTLSSLAPSYNPMSYHNGSIWPHDNAIAVAGLLRYDQAGVALDVFNQVFDAAQGFRGFRLPELYCGFTRDHTAAKAPAAYPVSCSPQAWAAGAPYLMVQALLGMAPVPGESRIRLHPHLPNWLEWVRLDDLRVGPRRVGLRVARRGDAYEVDVTAGEIEVLIEARAPCASLR